LQDSQIEQAWQGRAECRECGIRDLVLFSDLHHPDFALIHQPIDDLHYPAGSILYRSGEHCEHVFTIRAGLVKLVQYLPSGNRRIVRLLRQGDLAGIEVLVGQPCQHEAAVLEPVRLCRIPVTVVERLSRETPRLHRQLLNRWQRAVSDADAWITALSTGTARARVARLLLRLSESDPDGTCYLPGREDLGAMLGITTETASRVVAELVRAGLVRPAGPRRARILRADLDRIALA
jgi:CRP-like cAMP-binding protein